MSTNKRLAAESKVICGLQLACDFATCLSKAQMCLLDHSDQQQKRAQ